MPIYEYRCKKCGKTFEYMQRMTDAPKKKCEACGASALERLISNTSFQLKGSGWYKDLYSSSKPAASSSDSGSDAGSGSGSGSGSDPGSGSGSDSTATSEPKATKTEKKDTSKKAKKGASK